MGDEHPRFRVDGTREGASRVAPVGDYESVRDAWKWAEEEAYNNDRQVRFEDPSHEFVLRSLCSTLRCLPRF
eukprot:SAG31_NODE_9545_length_1260_cov_1.569337_2_plen_72_part_00